MVFEAGTCHKPKIVCGMCILVSYPDAPHMRARESDSVTQVQILGLQNLKATNEIIKQHFLE